MRVRWGYFVAACALLAFADDGGARAGEGGDGGVSFRLEGKSAVDDVFGDASDYRRSIDRFLELTTQMQSVRDDFARLVQSILAETTRVEAVKKRVCPVNEVAAPYARAQQLGSDYLRVGRELTRFHDQIKEYDRLGESIGLTPDYRWKVRKVLAAYTALLVDYREMKVAFHDQLNDELRYARCDLTQLLQKGAVAGIESEWPAPGAVGAPGVVPPKAERDANHDSPPALPPERAPPVAPIVVGRKPPESPRGGILFYVDNQRCKRATVVFVDGKRLGEVGSSTRVSFQTTAGPHELCVLDERQKTCGAPGTVRRAYFHEGWTISLRCD